MAATASFRLDFTQWDASLKAAAAKMKDFEKVGDDAARTFAKLARSFSGQQIQKEAKATLAAIEAIGEGATSTARLISGASRLTVAEQRKVNAMATEALEKYKALGQEAPKDLHLLAQATRQVTTETQKLAAPTAAAAESVASLAAKYITVGAAIAVAKQAIGGLVDFLSSSIKSYADAEAAQNRMVAALRAQGTATPAVIRQYAALASTIQRTTAFSDDAANEMEALFVQIGDVGPAQMEKATKAATDLAAGLGVDLRTATMLVAKAMEGNTGALGRYGIKIDEAKVAAEGADAVFAAIQDRFGGQAVAQLDTYAGKLEQLANNWDNVKEAVGKFLVTNELSTLAMRALADAMVTVSDESEDATFSVAQFWQAATGDKTGAAVIALLEDYAAGLNAVAAGARMVAGLKSPFAGLATGLPKIVGGMEELDKQFDASKKAADKARAAAEAAAKAYKTWAAAVTGLDKAMKAAALEKNLARLSAEGKLTATATQAIIKEYNELRPSLERLSAPLEDLRTNYQDVLVSTRAFGAAQAMVNSRTLPDAARMFQVGQTAVDQFGVHLKYLESTSIDLVVAMNAVPGAIKSTAVAADLASKTLGQRIGESLKENLGNAVAGIPEIITQGILHDASWEDMAIAIASMIGAAIGAAVGGALAGPAGAQVGAALGSLLGPLLDKLWTTAAEKTQKRIRTEFGGAITEGLAQAIEDAADRFGGDVEAAKVFNLDKIIAEVGGLTPENIDRMFAKFRDVFVGLETGVFTLAEAQEVLNKNFKTFAEYVTKDGALASKQLLEIIRLNDEMGTSSAAVAEFVTAQVTSALGGLTQFLSNAQVTSQAAAEGIAASVFGAFEALTRQGASPLEAIKQLTPVLEQLDAQLKAAGFSGGAAFDQLRAMAALASDSVKGPLIEAITGLGVALEGLHNSGVLTEEMFAGLSTQISDTYAKLIAQGTDGAQALQLIAPSLQTLFELQEDFGYAVDDATQALIDQGVAAGVVGDQHRSVQEKMQIALERTADAVEYLAKAFGYVEDAASDTADAVNKIPRNVDIDVQYNAGRLPNPDFGPAAYSGGEAPEANIGFEERRRMIRGYARGGVVYAQNGMWAPRGTDTVPAMLTPGEMVLPRELVAALRSGADGRPIIVNVTLTLDGAEIARSPGFRRAHSATVAGNDGGYRTDLRTAIGVR